MSWPKRKRKRKMAILRKNELKQMNLETLDSKLKDLRRELIRINAQVAIKTLPENPGRVREIKKTIARLITIKKIKQEEKTKK